MKGIMPRHRPGKMFTLPMGDGRLRVYWWNATGQVRSQARAEKKARRDAGKAATGGGSGPRRRRGPVRGRRSPPGNLKRRGWAGTPVKPR